MTTIRAQMFGDTVLLQRDELERLLELARQSDTVDVRLEEDDPSGPDMARLAEQGGAFDFWLEDGEGIYSSSDGMALEIP